MYQHFAAWPAWHTFSGIVSAFPWQHSGADPGDKLFRVTVSLVPLTLMHEWQSRAVVAVFFEETS